MGRSGFLATSAGIAAIALWSSNIAFSRSIMEREGIYNAGFYTYFYSGLCNLLILTIFFGIRSFRIKFLNLPFSYYLSTGIFFILSNTLLYFAIGMASGNEELLIISILNYTWPILIYVIKIPMFRLHFKKGLLSVGLMVSMAGILLAFIQDYRWHDLHKIMEAGSDNGIAYLLTLLNSISWALYSNLTVRYRKADDIVGMPVIFMLISLVFLIFQLIRGEGSTIAFSAIYTNHELLYQVVGPTSAGYLFWYLAMKNGNRYLVTSLSFFIPLFSVMIIKLKFSLPFGTVIFIAALLLISGSIMTYRSIQKGSA